MSQDTSTSEDLDFDSQNIFDDFSQSQEIGEEVQKLEEQEKKNMYYYFKKISTFLFSFNILILILIVVSLVYVYIQTSEVKKEYSFLKPICTIFLGDSHISEDSCYGVNPMLEKYKTLLETEKQTQLKKVLPLLGEIYSIENFNLSKKVSFLLDKSKSRVRPLDILTAFDRIKTSFAPIDKSELECYDMRISSDNILELTCDAYSSDWNTEIVSYKDGNIVSIKGGGTSISKASSFILFVENVTNSPFIVLEKPNTLNSEKVQSGPYTQKTTIQLRLQYNYIDPLSS